MPQLYTGNGGRPFYNHEVHLRLFKQVTTSTPGIFQDSGSRYLFGQERDLHSASHPGPVEEPVKPRTLDGVPNFKFELPAAAE